MTPFKLLAYSAISATLLLAFFHLDHRLNRAPTPADRYPKQGIASWYVSKETASTEPYDPESFTCAMRRRDFGKQYWVCNSANGRCVRVRHNNFGPYWMLFARGRIVDLSRRAFAEIADLERGLVPVTVFEVQTASP